MNAQEQPFDVRIADGSDWQFANGDWADGDDGLIQVAGDLNGQPDAAMQGMHYAFNTSTCCLDCTFDFEIRLQGHTDTGVIFRARDASHFYVLHFPNCGQQSRAQHFWVALSKMDDSGYLRRVKMTLVNAVPSTLDIWLKARVRVEGPRVYVHIGDYGYVEFEDHTYAGPGHVGVFCYGRSDLRGLRVLCVPNAQTLWNPMPTQRTNWQLPSPSAQRVWQQPVELKRFDDGELLLQVNLQKILTAGMDAASVPHLTKSTDNGRTWSDPWIPDVVGEGSSWASPRIHLTPAGRLLLFSPDTDHKNVFESTDRGKTWSSLGTANLHLGPPRDQPVQELAPAGFLNLRDGSMIALMIMGFKLHPDQVDLNVRTWGGLHCQAFCSRSEDDGRTWSTPVNMDMPGYDQDGDQLEGNLDLTEASAFETASGRIYALIRPIFSPWMWQTWSDDGGRTWGACVRGPFPGYAAPNMVRTASGATLIAHRMPALCIHCTRDDGVTWDPGTTIDSGMWAMGSMAQVEPDIVLYVYWDSYEGLMRSQRIAVTPSDLSPA